MNWLVEFMLCCMPYDDISLFPRQGLSKDYKKFWDMKHSSNFINQIIIQPDHVMNFNIIQAGNMSG